MILYNPTDYSSYITTYKEEAGNARYERGMELMNQNNKNSYRDAYYEFQKALSLNPAISRYNRKMDEAYTSASPM